MSKKNIIIAIVVIVIAAVAYLFMSSSSASCSPEEYAAKAAALNSKIVSMQQSNPEAFQQAMNKMQEVAQKMAQNPDDLSTACQALDEIDSMLK